MSLLPFSLPKVGLTIDSRMIGFARITRIRPLVYPRIVVQSYDTRQLPPGVVTVSHAEPNIKDTNAVVSAVLGLTAGRGTTGRARVPVSLTLHGLCARIALLEFERFPEKEPERSALLAWRFQKDFHLTTTNARLAYRVFGTAKPHESVRVLAGLIQLPIIEQYESVCEEAGLIPTAVGLSVFRIFDLCRLVVATHAAHAEEVFFLFFEEKSFSFFALRDSVPVFVRVKGIGERHGGAGEAYRSGIANEVRATLQFYDDRIRKQPWQHGGDAPARPLFVFDGCSNHDEPSIERASTLDRLAKASLGIHEFSLEPDGILRSRLIGTKGAVPAKGLLALSGVLAA